MNAGIIIGQKFERYTGVAFPTKNNNYKLLNYVITIKYFYK